MTRHVFEPSTIPNRCTCGRARHHAAHATPTRPASTAPSVETNERTTVTTDAETITQFTQLAPDAWISVTSEPENEPEITPDAEKVCPYDVDWCDHDFHWCEDCLRDGKEAHDELLSDMDKDEK